MMSVVLLQCLRSDEGGFKKTMESNRAGKYNINLTAACEIDRYVLSQVTNQKPQERIPIVCPPYLTDNE